MILAGYNYGTQYWGAPVLGPLLFCVVTFSLGVLFDWLYENTRCIWIPAWPTGRSTLSPLRAVLTSAARSGAARRRLIAGSLADRLWVSGLPACALAVAGCGKRAAG